MAPPPATTPGSADATPGLHIGRHRRPFLRHHQRHRRPLARSCIAADTTAGLHTGSPCRPFLHRRKTVPGVPLSKSRSGVPHSPSRLSASPSPNRLAIPLRRRNPPPSNQVATWNCHALIWLCP
ncbi:unnamed protein product [Urochloa humidicola]